MALAEVVGWDEHGQPIVGEIMGDMDGEVMGAGRHRSRHMRIPAKPSWRNQLAPGVIQPDEGMVPLALTPQAGSPPGTFTSTLSAITWIGRLQKPYRPERLIVTVSRQGADAIGRLLGQLYVGTDLQQATIQGWDIEAIGSNTAFGTRLTCHQAEPGVEISLIVNLSTAMTVTSSFIFASVQFLGRVVH
jgi:hypothetical protein